MTDWENNGEAILYDGFYVDGREEKYRLTIGQYVTTLPYLSTIATASDSLSFSLCKDAR